MTLVTNQRPVYRPDDQSEAGMFDVTVTLSPGRGREADVLGAGQCLQSPGIVRGSLNYP